jgi:hypothetical protein
MNTSRLLVFLAVSAAVTIQPVLNAKSRSDIPLAPLPGRIASARNIFLANGGGDDLAFDAVYADFKQWPRYSIVDTPALADIVIQIRSVNTVIGVNSRNSRANVSPPLEITIFDAGSKELLWSHIEHRRIAILEKNREKEAISAAERLVANLKARLNTN